MKPHWFGSDNSDYLLSDASQILFHRQEYTTPHSRETITNFDRTLGLDGDRPRGLRKPADQDRLIESQQVAYIYGRLRPMI